MQNIAGNLVEMLSRIAFPKVGIIDIIQIALIDQALRQHERQASGGFRQGERRAG